MRNKTFFHVLVGCLPPVRRQAGFTLVEAMVGVVIFSVGFLSLASLQSDLLSSTGESKARTEAVQIAEQEIEQLRALVGEYTDKAAFNDDMQDWVDTPPVNEYPVDGTNAIFSVRSAITGGSASTGWEARVTVGWTPARGDAQQVALWTVIGWDSSTAGARASDGAGMLPADSRISSPSGEARIGGRVYKDAIPGTETNFGDYRVHRDDDGGPTEWIRDDGVTMLTIDSGNDFIIIEGYFHPESNARDLYPRATGASLCEWGYDSEDPNKYFCVVGPGWYGAIGFIDGDARAYAGACVGDPDATDSGKLDTLIPAYTTVRTYRGADPVGIQVGTPGSDGYVVFGEDIYNDVRQWQNFAQFTPQNKNETCEDDFPTVNVEGPKVDGFDGNSGRFVCLTGGCPTDYTLPD